MPPSLPARLRARWTADDLALVVVDDRGQTRSTLSYGELAAHMDRASRALGGLALPRGAVLALQGPRTPDWLAVLLAAWSRGIAVLLLNPAYTPTELRFFLQDAGAQAAILPQRVRAALGADAPPGPAAEDLSAWLVAAPEPVSGVPTPSPASDTVDDSALAVLAYTSGTTGRPKGARIRHRDILGTVEALHSAWQWSATDVLVHTLPLFHIHGLFVAALGALWAGARTVLLPHFSAGLALEMVARHKGTVLMGVPTHHHRYLALPADGLPDTSSLRLVTSGSAPLPAERHARFRARFGLDIVERYGMTEVGIVLSNPLDGERRPGTVGRPLPGVQTRVVDGDGQAVPTGETGELWVHSPGLFAGYHGLPEATARALVQEDGRTWMRTGDLCRLDPDGVHRIVGRSADMVISGGLNIYPREVEAALREIGGNQLLDVAIVGVPHEEWGERLVGIVELRAGAVVRFSDWISACRERLAAYKCPKELRMVGALPRNAMGKVQKHHVRTDWAAGSGRFGDGATWLEITTNPGLEDLVGAELQQLLQAADLAPATVEREPKGARGRLLARIPADRDAVLACARGLRSAHHLLRPLGRWQFAGEHSLQQIHGHFAALHIDELTWDGTGDEPSFRVSCERSGTHDFTSEDVARTVGSAVRSVHPRPVDLKGYDVHVRADVRRDRCHGGIQLTARSLTTRYDRPYRPQIKLRPNMAWAMAELARTADNGPAQVVLDPFCGSGTLLAEAGRRWPGARLLASDVRPACVAGTIENALHLGLDTLTCREGDARAVDELWADQRPDTVLANLPFGLRLGRTTNHYWLYRKFLEGLSRITEPGARVVLLVGKKKLMNRVLLPGWVFRALHVRIVEMGGAWPALFLLERRSVPAIPRPEPADASAAAAAPAPRAAPPAAAANPASRD